VKLFEPLTTRTLIRLRPCRNGPRNTWSVTSSGQPLLPMAWRPSGHQPANWVQVFAFATSCGASSRRPVPSARATQARSVMTFAARTPWLRRMWTAGASHGFRLLAC
jgi:hypothetical protein